MVDLKPCPFCGSAAIEPPRECEAAWCRKCFASGPVPGVYALNDFIAAWNQRAEPPKEGRSAEYYQEIEAVREKLREVYVDAHKLSEEIRRLDDLRWSAYHQEHDGKEGGANG